MKKILFIYPSMFIGGSTTALLAYLNSINSEQYEVDLQLMRHDGPLMGEIPKHVRVLPAAERYRGICGRVIKLGICLFKGYFIKAIGKGLKRRKWISRAVIADFQAKELCNKNEKHYDYAVGFLEGWANRYVAYCVEADKKYAWIHSMFHKTTTDAQAELSWMNEVDKIAFVADACREDFEAAMPEVAQKAITIENITDINLIRQRSMQIDEKDEAYKIFVESKQFKIVTVCRLIIAVKGLDRIVACAAALKQKGHKFLWYIIGDGADEKELQEMIANSRVEDCLCAIGKRTNPYPFMAAADIMCMPSRYEGKPLAVTESMILGVPPVVTAYASAEEQIQNNVDGIVVNNDDTAIINAVEKCITMPDTAQKMHLNLIEKDYSNSGDITVIEKAFCEGNI